MREQVSVTAIKKGTVIDHLPPGIALKLIQLLGLDKQGKQLTVGMHLKSRCMKRKDLIKIEGKHLDEEETQGIAILAPSASISFIDNFEVTQKKKASLPKYLTGFLRCPNPRCITQDEPISTHFHIEAFGADVLLTCEYCEKIFKQEEMRGFSV